MKICICTNTRPHEGGVNSYINSLAKGLCQFGHDVDIITPLGTAKQRQLKISLTKKVDWLLKDKSWLVLVLYNLTKLWLFFIIAYNLWRKKYQIIYAIDVSAANTCSRLRSIFKMPLVLNVQSSMTKDLLNQQKLTAKSVFYKYFINEEKKAFGSVDHIIANSNYTKKFIQDLAPFCAPITISRNLVDEDLFFPNPQKNSLRQLFNLPEKKFVVLYPGRLVKRKGVIYLLLAMIKLAKEDNEYFLVYAGDGPERKRLENQISKNSLAGRVKIIGSVPNQRMGDLYNASDIAVIPSITYRGLAEPLGITALEAMATGIPLIASAIGGLKETIKNRFNGLLIKEKNVNALAQAIKSLKDSHALRETLSKNGLKEVAEKYTKTKVAQNVSEIFQACIKDEQR